MLFYDSGPGPPRGVARARLARCTGRTTTPRLDYCGSSVHAFGGPWRILRAGGTSRRSTPNLIAGAGYKLATQATVCAETRFAILVCL